VAALLAIILIPIVFALLMALAVLKLTILVVKAVFAPAKTLLR
jgi:hypothetical protein